MYSNVYKSGWVVVQDTQARIIDNNALIEKKLSTSFNTSKEKREEYPENEEGFTSGLDTEQLDALFAQEGSESIIKGSAAAERDAILMEIEQAKEELADLKSQADSMIDEAKSQIGAMQIKAYEEAKQQGLLEGQRIGKQEADAVKEEYLLKKKQLEEEYDQKLEELEPKFIETLTGIYEHIFKVDLSHYGDLVASLLISTMQNIETTKNFLVHVSKEDYEKVAASRERIRAQAGGSVSVELVEDMTLSRAQCFIETENGIYDCSLDTQLSELERKLKLLSYERT